LKFATEYIDAQTQHFLNANLVPTAAERAFASFTQMLLGSNEFLYVE
jgi:hypothetical protein